MRDEPGLTIDELSASTGVSVRNIRSYQTKGLLPGPELGKRNGPWIGFYSHEHEDRLSLISRLRRRGFSLDSIRQLIDASHEGIGLTEMLGLEAEIIKPIAPEAPETVTRSQLRARFPEMADDHSLEDRIIEIGLATRSGRDMVLRDPSLVQVAQQLSDAGIPLRLLLDAFEVMRDGATATARDVAKVLRPALLDPLLTAALADEGGADQIATLQQIPALGAEAMRLVFLEAIRSTLAVADP